MNIQLNKRILAIAAMGLALAVGVVSCVSSQKTTDRGVAGISEIAANIVQIFKDNAERYSQNFESQSSAKRLTSAEIQKFASSTKLNLQNAEVIIDNDAAFDSKLAMIKSAQKSIRMVYFIYADDDSASVITNELIKKAQSGVKVKLLVDILTNYGKMDLFSMMTKEGRGNIDVRFYNFPSERIIADAKYMTLPCPKEEKPESDSCQKFKSALMKSMASQESTFFSRMMLAGLYGKSVVALKVALGIGGGIDPADYKKKDGEEDQDIGQVFDFFKLMIDAKIKHDIGAMIKLQIAMAMYADKLNPVMNELTGRLPLISESVTPNKKTSHAQEWDHFTDYVHHKLVAVDGNEFQLGGRNIEDSYHMKSRLGTKGKYIFMDTDFHAVTAAGGTAEIEKSYDALFNMKEMVADFATVNRVMPYDIPSNPQALGMAAGSCMQDAKAGTVTVDKLGTCIEERFAKMPNFVTESARQEKAKSEMNASAANYLTNYAATSKKQLRDNWKLQKSYGADSSRLSQADLQTAEIYYVENTPFNIKSADKIRKVGSKIGAEADYNKNIHALWYKGLENVCKVSRDQGVEKRIVFHSAYLFMPSGLIHKLAKMLNGDYGDCSKVRVTLLTNSFQTTDLNFINVFARYQMVQLFKHYAGLVAYEKQFNEGGKFKYGRWFPKLDYFEYNASAMGTGISLHTKLSVLGDDVLIGSANADARSYYMDTNNGVFIRNAHEFNRDYVAFVDNIITDSKKSTEWTQTYADYTDEKIALENKFIVGALIKRWDKKGKVNAEKKAEILATIDRLGKRVTDATYRLINFRGEFERKDLYSNGGSTGQNLELELNELSNSFDDLFKML
jgi:cardiolipin synthase C